MASFCVNLKAELTGLLMAERKESRPGRLQGLRLPHLEDGRSFAEMGQSGREAFGN